jgi:hypothetical protein
MLPAAVVFSNFGMWKADFTVTGVIPNLRMTALER